MYNLKMRAVDLGDGIMAVDLLDEAGDLLCYMRMPKGVWEDENQRREYVLAAFSIEAERMLNE